MFLSGISIVKATYMYNDHAIAFLQYILLTIPTRVIAWVVR
jgi:hypothetical protein